MQENKKYKIIARELRKSLDVVYCYDCPYHKECFELNKTDEDDCDTVRIKLIEKRLKTL